LEIIVKTLLLPKTVQQEHRNISSELGRWRLLLEKAKVQVEHWERQEAAIFEVSKRISHPNVCPQGSSEAIAKEFGE
jgi:hypothetical protein